MELKRVRYNCAILTIDAGRVSVMGDPETLDALEREFGNKAPTANAQKETALGMPKMTFNQPPTNGRTNGSGTKAAPVAANAAAGGQGRETALGLPRLTW